MEQNRYGPKMETIRFYLNPEKGTFTLGSKKSMDDCANVG